jgi:hypothetical protein
MYGETQCHGDPRWKPVKARTRGVRAELTDEANDEQAELSSNGHAPENGGTTTIT